MPVKRVKGGYRWGKHGKVYPSKKAAAKQGQAAYASGYRGDAKTHTHGRLQARRAATQKLVSAGRVLEGKTVTAMRRLWKTKVLPPFLALAEKFARVDAHSVDIDLKDIDKHADDIAGAVRVIFNKTGDAAIKVSKRRRAVLGITQPGHPSPITAEILKARENAVMLVEKARRAYADDVREIFTDPENFGVSVKDLKAELLDRGNVWESRAELIARDQTLKLNGAIARAEQRSVGISRYIWSTSLDERVREMHAELEGTTQDWNVAPVTDKYGNTNHPGQDFQCRCTAIPVLEEPVEGPSGEE